MSIPQKNLLVDVWLAHSLARRLVDQGLAGTPLSTDEFALYGLIVDLGPATPTQLGRWTGMAATTLSALTRRCEARGELKRRANPDDRRSSHLALTKAGMRLYKSCLGPLHAAITAVHENLPGDVLDVRLALQDVDSALRAVLGVDERPYRLEPVGETHVLDYSGPALTTAQRSETLAFVEWLRHRDAARSR